MEYNIITSHNHTTLKHYVNDLIGYGWEPIGGCSFIGYDGDARCWAQAMIKRETKEKKEGEA